MKNTLSPVKRMIIICGSLKSLIHRKKKPLSAKKKMILSIPPSQRNKRSGIVVEVPTGIWGTDNYEL